jgi:hypothetical protein
LRRRIEQKMTCIDCSFSTGKTISVMLYRGGSHHVEYGCTKNAGLVWLEHEFRVTRICKEFEKRNSK